QALRIDSLLQKHLPAKEYTRRQVLCGNAAQFQGDERDVIFLSMVDIPRGDGPLSLRSEDANDFMYKKRFNVAASRARDQLWVVHSLDPDIDLKDGDIRKRLIRHALNPHASSYQIAANEKRTESEFELQVMKRLVQAGYRVIPQWAAGSYRIDLVVEGAGKRLAVECDGDRWHTADNLEADMTRQAILERLGWRFVRIRGSEFFRNQDKAMQAVFSRLRDLEIVAEGMEAIQDINNTHGHQLRKKIIQCAAELRQEWSQQSGKLPVIH
ncbi:MAG TPA: DUF559 domain-containing protein, partial [Ktedonobacteraceae bacterium]|nr:DUF559 domain-containing protein [Ktedonobacteraceae bacterium]